MSEADVQVQVSFFFRIFFLFIVQSPFFMPRNQRLCHITLFIRLCQFVIERIFTFLTSK